MCRISGSLLMDKMATQKDRSSLCGCQCELTKQVTLDLNYKRQEEIQMRTKCLILINTALLLIVLVLVSAVGAECEAGELEAVVLSSTKFTERYDHGTGTWVGLQINYNFDNDLYIFGSQEDIDVLLLGGKAWTYDIKGVGVGTKYRVNKRLRLFSQVGYYMIKDSIGQRHKNEDETFGYYLGNRYSSDAFVIFDEVGLKHSEYTFGIAVGAEFIYPITKNWTTGFVVSYRRMKIKEDISGYNDDWVCPYGSEHSGGCDKLHSAQNEDYSSINIGLNLVCKF